MNRLKSILLFIMVVFMTNHSAAQSPLMDSLENNVIKMMEQHASEEEFTNAVVELTSIYWAGNTIRGVEFLKGVMRTLLVEEKYVWFKIAGASLALLYKNQGNYAQALDLNLMYLTLETSYRGGLGKAWGMLEIGNMYFEMKLFNKAIEYYNQASVLFTQALPWPLFMFKNNHEGFRNAIHGLAVVYDNLGLAFLKKNDVNNALLSHSKALSWRKKADYPYATAYTYMYLARIRFLLGNNELAKSMIDSAQTVVVGIGPIYRSDYYNQFAKADIDALAGRLFLDLKEYNLSRKYYHQSQILLKKLDSKKFIIRNYLEMYELELSSGKKAEGLFYLIKAYNLSVEGKFSQLQRKATEKLAEFYRSEGGFKESNNFYSELHAMSDSLLDANMVGLMLQSENFFDLQKKSNQLKVLSQQQEIVSRSLKVQEQRVIFLLLLLVSVLIGIIAFFRIARMRKRYFNELALKNKQLIETNQKLALKEDELNNSNLAKEKFIEILAHDIRGPLSGILGISELAAHRSCELADDLLIRYSKTMFQSVQRLFGLIENLLKWSLLQRDRPQKDNDILLIKVLVSLAVDVVSPLTNSKNITIIEEVDSDLTYVGDAMMIDSLIRNLLSNAIKFSRDGGEVRIIATNNEDNFVLRVIDNGMGMSSDVKDNLFRLDKMMSTPGTSGERGSGLGLLLCHEYVKLHSGTISVESEPGKGTTFTVQLPLQSSAADFPANQPVE